MVGNHGGLVDVAGVNPSETRHVTKYHHPVGTADDEVVAATHGCQRIEVTPSGRTFNILSQLRRINQAAADYRHTYRAEENRAEIVSIPVVHHQPRSTRSVCRRRAGFGQQ
ncbi:MULTISPECIES: hypothetical protein [Actinoalloteichus]|uniref:hypothetical protein n=1 Tax=Actinoalloteichus TaxID=65496 RepID=UPI001FE0EC73|nr:MULTISPECIES: hypothetical protein [Actinoalloteichus]